MEIIIFIVVVIWAFISSINFKRLGWKLGSVWKFILYNTNKIFSYMRRNPIYLLIIILPLYWCFNFFNRNIIGKWNIELIMNDDYVTISKGTVEFSKDGLFIIKPKDRYSPKVFKWKYISNDSIYIEDSGKFKYYFEGSNLKLKSAKNNDYIDYMYLSKLKK
ncbi:hypothetical protein NAT51_17070 [Flavobacterium amniphilum]|uniref:hypothetical protein n=1 Tax=Flavobacterium amniphilum TaxID=1834035 RepID=UPI00202A39C4|nr:hypothetical protein [Flavobacterium amniphilum]MCL9807246.1 hypothetical protein [Flavobacterium amniphilum]